MEDDDGRGGAAHRQLAKALDAQRVGVGIGLLDEDDVQCRPAGYIRMDREAASTPGCSLPACRYQPRASNNVSTVVKVLSITHLSGEPSSSRQVSFAKSNSMADRRGAPWMALEIKGFGGVPEALGAKANPALTPRSPALSAHIHSLLFARGPGCRARARTERRTSCSVARELRRVRHAAGTPGEIRRIGVDRCRTCPDRFYPLALPTE
jgi:hypothetical protein